jgi:hypothetical protein
MFFVDTTIQNVIRYVEVGLVGREAVGDDTKKEENQWEKMNNRE